ncbi:nickel-type superoxide dismutase maturation protease [Gloeocapsa sp. PCC 73106]|uniref:nickel-type superoxide dismutase maturation protease n=1 Tax=Gloeocapsa sp. PCC 73106 TaxID=102232 RepID=UPI0002ABBAD0|nr:nickel-type superoxide dismutase maturation protease [Gloeocapsa sp. PCC 73106]ELR96637.1 nickel-type superoxide dismutase maturation protease [Gloeocapsa sp. PCC 73106]
MLLWFLRQRSRLRVVGRSMLPTLQPGDEVLVNYRAYQRSLPQVGDIVVAWHPEKPRLRVIKRLTMIGEDGCCVLLGDNPEESTDSRYWGGVTLSHILAQVVCRC